MKIFKFEKEDITRFIEYELKTFSKFREPLNYVIKNLENLGHSITIKSLDKKIDLNKIKEREGKNYHWSVFNYKNATLVVRRYKQHLTIFTRVIKEGVDYMERPKTETEYSAFTLNTDFDKFDEDKHDEMMDSYYDKPFTDLNTIIKNLFKLMLDEKYGAGWVWNSACLKRPDHVKIELAFSEKSIHSIDNFVFCMEELDNIYLELFSENTTFQKIKEYKTGEKLNEYYEVGEVSTDVKNDYYHGVGISLIDAKNKKDKKFEDVYSLTRWFFDTIFKDEIYLYKGDVYVQGGELKEGEPCAYKDEEDDNVIIYKSTYPAENFISLKKY